MIRSIKVFLKDLTDFVLEEQPEMDILSPAGSEVEQEDSQKENEVETTEVNGNKLEPEIQLLKCKICGKSITWKEEADTQKTEIEGIVAEMQLMGSECCVELFCYQCASMMAKNQNLPLQPYHFCFYWGNKDWNDELREIAKYYGEEFAQKSRANQEDFRHKVIIDNLDEYKTMLQVLRRMNFRYPRKDITALLTEPEKRTYERFTGKKLKE